MALTEDAIRDLAGFKSGAGPVVSLYLDVDGRRWPRYADCEDRAARLVKQALDRVSENGHRDAAADLERVEAQVRGGLARSTTRGLAVFASGEALWKVIELPVAVKDQLVVNECPHVHQLEGVFNNHMRFGVLLADRQRARVFVFELGEIVEKDELFEALPRHEDDAGDRDRGHERGHFEAAVHQHLKHAAKAAFEVYKHRPFDHLIVGAPDDIAPELERDLHSYLKERIAARVSVPPSASEHDIRSAVLEVETRVERAKEQAMVERVRNGAAAGRGGVVGLDEVLAAIGERRVDTLVVSQGFATPGWQCTCGQLATRGRVCAICSAEMDPVEDVVEAAMAGALHQAAHVEMCVDNADLDVAGRIGALTRF